MADLLPCPFCGGEAGVERYGTSRQSCIVACTSCGCRTESNEHGAGRRWNLRTATAEAALQRANAEIARLRKAEARLERVASYVAEETLRKKEFLASRLPDFHDKSFARGGLAILDSVQIVLRELDAPDAAGKETP